MSNATAIYARASVGFDHKLAQSRALLRLAEHDFAPVVPGDPPLISQGSSLGAEDTVITHLINSMELNIGIFVLDTGQFHPETLQLLEQLKATSRAPVEVFTPVNEAVVQFVRREGKDAMYKSLELRKACCHIRKVEPLQRALKHKKAWITGLRREQSGARAEVPFIDHSDVARAKFNPLADWTWGDVWHYIEHNQVAYNPLHDQFFPSIGCAPCTRAISLGEDFRAGRWWWESEDLKECGLHVTPDSTAPSAVDSHHDEPAGFASKQGQVSLGDVTSAGRVNLDADGPAQANFSAAEVKGTPVPGPRHSKKQGMAA